MSSAPKTAMVLAAGLGTRMRPLTDDRPKALVKVGGKALVDHVLDRLADVGVERAVVNVHWFADRLEDHLSHRLRPPTIAISDERGELLETGGGLKRARFLLGEEPVFVANIDSIWLDRGDAMGRLVELWDAEKMDAALLLADRAGSLGFDGDGDFFHEPDGRLRFRGDAAAAPYAYMGVHICRPDYVEQGPEGPFSLTPFWRRSAAAGRLYGCRLDGEWMHVGDPDARDLAEKRLAIAS